MKKDFWGPRSKRYHKRRFEFVRKVRAVRTPLRFAWHRREERGNENEDEQDMNEEERGECAKEGLFGCYYGGGAA